MTNWSSLSVKNAIIKIKDREMVLPVIQRRLVWTEEKMEMLFDSLLKGISFGSIICIEEEKDSRPLFAFREFTRDGNDMKSIEIEQLSKTQLFVVDGQQRIQSFYMGLAGTHNSKRLFFDLYSNHKESEYSFKFASNSSDDVLKKTTKEHSNLAIKESLWYPVYDLFERLSITTKARPIAKEIINKFNIQDAEKANHIKINVQTFFNTVFSNESIGVSKISVNKSKDIISNRQYIVELFRRLNDGGTKLSSYDLMSSMFKGFDYKMESFLDSVVSEQENQDIGINQDVLIKLMLILHDKPSKELSDLTVEDAGFAASNFKRIEESLKATRQFLKVTSLYNWFAGSKKRSAIPLYFLTYNIFHSVHSTDELSTMFDRFDTNDKNCHDMSVWLRLSLLNKVFSDGGKWVPNKTGIKKIHMVMSENKGKTFPVKELFAVYKEHQLDFLDKVTGQNINKFNYEFTLYLAYNGQFMVKAEMFSLSQPYSFLTKRGFGKNEIIHVANWHHSDPGINHTKRKEYELHTWLENHIEDAKREGYLSRHFIPNNPELWKVETFDKFIIARSKLLAKKIQSQLE